MAIRNLFQGLGQRVGRGLTEIGGYDPMEQVSPEQARMRRQEGLAALQRSLGKSSAILSGDPRRMQLAEQQMQQAKQDKLLQELGQDPRYAEQIKLLRAGLDPRLSMAGQRKIIKAADGYNYYADTGKRVLPGVEKEQSVDSQTTEYKNYLNSLEKGEIPTGAGFLAYQDRNIKKDKMSYGMKQDVNSYWRYTEGPMKGQRVFPDVTKEKEEEEKEPYNIGDEDKLRDDYRSESKEFVNVRNAFGRILSVEPTAAGDLSLIFNYMKMLDPGSVVRESEYENAAQSGAFGERVKAAYLRYKSGERLTESMRKDFKTQANNLYQTQSDNQSYVMEEFKNLAEEYGMKPSRIVQNYGSPIEDKLLEIKLKSLPLNELATLDLSQYSEKQLDIIKKVIKSKGKQ
jgi:hypothetical protein